jgi:RND family efflux transporter MFP subunit
MPDNLHHVASPQQHTCGRFRFLCCVLCFCALGVFITFIAAPVHAASATQVAVDAVVPAADNTAYQAQGTVVPLHKTVLSPRMSGYVDHVSVKVGSIVAKGAPLAQLDTDLLQANLTLAEARAQSAAAALQESLADLSLAQQELSRLTDLKKSAAFSRAKKEDQTKVVAKAEATVAKRKAELAEARANTNINRLQLGYATLKSPFAGVVLEKNINLGSYVTPATQAFVLQDPTALEIEVYVPTTVAEAVRPGQRAHHMASNTSFILDRIIATENRQTGLRPLRFVPATPGELPFVGGQAISLQIPLTSTQKVLTLHKDAIVFKGNNPMVFVFRDGKAVLTPVTLGKALGTRYAVLSGVVAGDLLVIRGNERLKPDQPITVSGDGTATQ